MSTPTRVVAQEADFPAAQCFSVIFILQLLSTVAVSVVFSLLTLYLLFKLHLSQYDTYNFVAAYNALGYATSIIGGVLAERFLGYRFAVVLSAVCGGLGLLFVAIPTDWTLHVGLAAFSLAYGMMVPAIFVLLGRLHTMADQTRRERGFMVAYIAMDVGAFFAALLAGVISIHWGYGVAFVLAALCHFAVLFVFMRYRHLFAKTVGVKAPTRRYVQKSRHARWFGVLLMLGCLPVLVLLLDHARFCNGLLLGLGLGCIGLILYYVWQQRSAEMGKLLAFLILLIVSTVFDLSYFLNASVVTVFTEANVQRHFLGLTVPTATYAALNPFFVVMAGPFVGRFCGRLGQQGGGMASFPNRFALGIVLMGCGYLVLMLGAGHGALGRPVSSIWLLGGYLLQTLGELFISPTAYAMVGVLVPVSLEGMMMGICQFSSGVAGAMSGFMANWVAPPSAQLSLAASNLWYQHMFGFLGAVSVVLGLLVFLAAPALHRLAKGKPVLAAEPLVS